MKTIINFILVGVLLTGLFSNTSVANTNVVSTVKTDTVVTINVKGNCGMCKRRIEKAASIDGVSAAAWDAATEQLTVTYDASKTTKNKIKAHVADSGHDTEGLKAEDAIYSKLPGCCLYRDGNPHK